MNPNTPIFLSKRQILGDPKAEPPLQPIVPVSPATWYRGINEGRYPKPVQLSLRRVGWKSEDIEKLIEKLGRGGAE